MNVKTETKESLQAVIAQCDAITNKFKEKMTLAQNELKVCKSDSKKLLESHSPVMAHAVMDQTLTAAMEVVRGYNGAIASIWKLKEFAKLQLANVAGEVK